MRPQLVPFEVDSDAQASNRRRRRFLLGAATASCLDSDDTNGEKADSDTGESAECAAGLEHMLARLDSTSEVCADG